jgi:hypothetical protein
MRLGLGSERQGAEIREEVPEIAEHLIPPFLPPSLPSPASCAVQGFLLRGIVLDVTIHLKDHSHLRMQPEFIISLQITPVLLLRSCLSEGTTQQHVSL